MTTRQVEFGPCCFCGGAIAPTEVDPVRVSVETAGNKWQVWFAHGHCFKGLLHKHGDIDLSPAHF